MFSLPSVSTLPLVLSPFLCFVSVSPLFLLVVELLLTVAQGGSRGGDEEGRRWQFFSLLLSFLSFLVSISQNNSSLFCNLPSLLSLFFCPQLFSNVPLYSPPLVDLSPVVFIRRKRGREGYYPYPVMAQG
jgi:hypothetical protein